MPNLKCKNEIVKKNLDCRIIEEVEVKGSFNTYLEVFIFKYDIKKESFNLNSKYC